MLKDEGFSDENFPEIFSVVFDKNPKAKDVRHIVAKTQLAPTAADINRDNIMNMLSAHVGDMFLQFNSLPGLTLVDNTILEHGVLVSLGQAGKDLPKKEGQ